MDGAHLRAMRIEAGVGLGVVARRIGVSTGHLSRIERGERASTPAVVTAYQRVLGTGAAARTVATPSPARIQDRHVDEAPDLGGALTGPATGTPAGNLDPAVAAMELGRRVAASDVGDATLTQLEAGADRLAMAYAGTPPNDLLPSVRAQLAYVTRLAEARTTLAQRRRLMVTGGWLALLAAIVYVDMRHDQAAEMWLMTAEEMGGHAGHAEIVAWCCETRAWASLTSGRYGQAHELARQAQSLAPVGSSAMIQATAQEGRACARMGRDAETRDALDRVAGLVSNLPMPQQPEHHFRYDPTKAVSYTATTLSWLGDPTAEQYARGAIEELGRGPGGVRRPRRVAAARLDLGLALLTAGKPDEASAEALAAVTSGRVVPSNWWRAVEVLRGVERAGIREAAELREVFAACRPVPAAGQWR